MIRVNSNGQLDPMSDTSSRPFCLALRRGHVDDAGTISALAIQVFLDTYATEGVRGDLAREALSQCSTETFTKRLTEDGRIILLAERGAGLIGFAELLLASTAAPFGVAGSEIVR